MALASNWLSRLFPRRAQIDKPESDATTGATTGGGRDQEPVVVWEAANMMEAAVVKGRLEHAGIPAIVRGEALGAIYGLTTGALAAVDVLAPSALAEKALEILHSEVDLDEATPDES